MTAEKQSVRSVFGIACGHASRVSRNVFLARVFAIAGFSRRGGAGTIKVLVPFVLPPPEGAAFVVHATSRSRSRPCHMGSLVASRPVWLPLGRNV